MKKSSLKAQTVKRTVLMPVSVYARSMRNSDVPCWCSKDEAASFCSDPPSCDSVPIRPLSGSQTYECSDWPGQG